MLRDGRQANNLGDQIPAFDHHAAPSKYVGAGDCSISLVRKWIDACEGTYEKCKLRFAPNLRKVDQSSTFARVLDVLGDCHNAEPRLVEAQHVPADARYMTLSRTSTTKSHSTKQELSLTKCADCWGDPVLRPLMLTRRTLETMRVGIPLTTLPKTFQDAVTFTRAVGIRFYGSILYASSKTVMKTGKTSRPRCAIYILALFSTSQRRVRRTLRKACLLSDARHRYCHFGYGSHTPPRR